MRRGYLAVGLFLASFACIEGSAAAVVAATHRVSAFTASTSANKSLTVNCPAGQRALSPGAFIQVGDYNQVLIDDIRPDAGLTSVTVNALEDETGTADNWTLSVGALCATPPPGLERVSATSSLNSSNKSVTVNCPVGKRVFGTGADINSFNGQVILDDLRPNAALTSVTANALEDETGNSINWSLTAYAVCANAVAGLERVSETSALDSANQKVLFPACPNGKVPTGLGADVNSFNGQVLLDVLDISGLANSVVQGIEDETGNPINWSVTGYVICAPGSRREFVTSFVNSDPKNVNVTCQQPGQQVTGLGGVALDGNSEVLLERFRPDPPNNALVTAFEDDGGFSGEWQLSGNAVCTTPLPGQEILANATAQNSVAQKDVSVSCPGAKRVVGAAGEIFNGLGQVILDDTRPNAGLTTVTVSAYEDETGTSQSWSLTARAICADPLPGLERVTATSALDSAATKGATAFCPAGKNMLSAAFDLNTFNGQVLLWSVTTNDLLTQATASGREDATGNTANWSVTAYGICASP
jgi:hypothetical protein